MAQTEYVGRKFKVLSGEHAGATGEVVQITPNGQDLTFNIVTRNGQRAKRVYSITELELAIQLFMIQEIKPNSNESK